MAEQTILTKFKLRHDIASNWTSKNPVLIEGEIGFETDTLNFKVGNGSSNWSSLKYYIPDTSKFVTEDKLPDTSKFITISADNLINYYLKSETYTKEEVNSIINNVSKFNAVIVTTLPTSNISLTTIYLVAKTDTENNDYYDEYLYINNAWEMIGNTKIDLSNYYTKTQADSVFALKTDIPDIPDTSNFVTKSTEQTITGVKKFTNPIYTSLIRDYSRNSHLLSVSNGVQFFGEPNLPMYLDSSSLVVEGQVRPIFKYYDDEYEQHEFAFLDDMPMKTITDTSVRIWDLPSGTYILPNNCKIYYNGATNTANYYNAQGDRTILEVNTSKAGTEKFFRFEYTTGSNAYYQYYIFTGMTTASNGYVKGVDLNARYPTGAVYISTNTTSPASLFGGSWEELGTDKALWLTSVASANAGTTIGAGLPNITGSWYARGVESGNGTASGAFSFSADGGNYGTGHTSGARGGFSFNANNSNSIYGSSATVQPPAYRVYAWRRIS